jgi:hypothetical protein
MDPKIHAIRFLIADELTFAEIACPQIIDRSPDQD